MRSDFAKIGYDELPSSPNAVRLGGKLVLDDNFNLDNCKRLNSAGEDWLSLVSHGPFKLKLPFILFCKTGKIRITINLETFDLKTGDLLVCSTGFIVDGIDIDKEAKAGLIAFSPEEYYTGISQESTAAIRQSILSPKVMHLDDKRISLLVTTYGSMRSILDIEHFQFKEDALRGCMILLLSMVAQWMVSMEGEIDQTKSRNETLFLNFLGEVKASCTTERKISYYADKFHISPKYFAKLIYNASGRHAADWIRDQVIREAKAMLKTGSYTVQQISDSMGFPNASFFGKYFKTATGISPRRYIVENT